MISINRLKELRIKNGYKSQKQLADILFVNQTAVSQWERGATIPSAPILKKLSQIYGVSIDYILGAKDSPPEESFMVPVLGDVAAGIPIEAIQDIVDYEELDRAMTGAGEYFGLRLKGDSMEPRMRDGDVVIVRKQSDAETGDIVVAMVNGDSATVKKLKKGPSGITLIPNNPAFDPMFYSNEEIVQLPVRILGRVVELRAKF